MNAIRLAALSVLGCLVFGTANAQVVTIVTTPAGSFTNSIGAAIAKVVVEQGGLRATVSPQQSHGQDSVNDGSAELSLATITDVQQYVTGTVDFEGKGAKKNLRLIGRLVPIMMSGYVRLDSDIKTLADIKGKRIPSGYPAQRSVQRVVLSQLAGAGLSEADVRPVPARNIVASADDFAAGKTDIFWFALGAAKVKQVAASVGGLRAISIETTPAALAAMKKYVPGSYPVTLQPSKQFEEIRSQTVAQAYDVVFFTRADLADDVVYKITKAVFDNKKDMAAVFPGMNQFNPEQMSTKYDDLTYHPGAIKFFQEKGLWPPRDPS
ncbi:MAG: TAXI family TRAP transporter solute-binding subunit [Pseudolabrys sp.]|nr:TAXI family TRAP transporter solute-binding subunit [Pseudolabrys sp.]